MQMTHETDAPIILTEISDKVGVITLHRPQRRNALNGYLIKALEEAVQAMAASPDVKVVVLTGAPSDGAIGGFCSGGDTKEGGMIPGDPISRGVPHGALQGDLARHDTHAAMLLHQMPKPTIAMIGGPAVGAGCSLAAACDLRFASDDAVFASGFAPNGLTGDYGGTFLWTSIIGTARARELYLLNEKVSAADALAWGMVNRVLPAADLRAFTMGVAARLVRTSATVLAGTKANLNLAEEDTDRRRYLFAAEAENQVAAAADGRTRMEAKAAEALNAANTKTTAAE
jgi:2-(1,2-epoxy-1,2-dihydrophenyl)acetyl-CoA isomerase